MSPKLQDIRGQRSRRREVKVAAPGSNGTDGGGNRRNVGWCSTGWAARGSERARAIASSAEPACAAQTAGLACPAQVADTTRPARVSEGARAEAASTPGDSNA